MRIVVVDASTLLALHQSTTRRSSWNFIDKLPPPLKPPSNKIGAATRRGKSSRRRRLRSLANRAARALAQAPRRKCGVLPLSDDG